MRRTLSKYLSIVFFAYAAITTPAFAGTTISSVSPARIPFNKDSTIIVTGKGMKSIRGCAVLPVTSSVASGAVQVGSFCTATSNKSGNQLIVTVGGSGLQVTGTYNLAFTTDPVTNSSNLYDAKGGSTIILVEQIYAYDPTTANTGRGNNGGGTTDSTIHPYTDCIGQSDGPQLIGNQSVSPTNVLCGSSILPDSEVSDNFGYHVSQLYSAIQVRVSNKNSQYDFLLRDIILTLPNGRIISSRILRFAQGVAVKGKTHDRRSIWFNSLTAAGGVYGALASFGSVGFTTAGNVFQGAFMASFNQIFPDYTADNVNRFNNAVFNDQNPSIVPKDSIGQPPLYVLALVPKEPGIGKDAAYAIAKNIAVSIEGTFIKQVNLLSLSKSTLSFQPQFISPPAFAKPNFDFTDLTTLSESQQFSLTNSGSATMNIHGFKIVPSGTSQTVVSSDYDVDTKSSNCGIGGGTVSPSTGTAFSLAPNASCVIALRFHPTTIGQVNATLVFDGDNLEGSASITLTGTGVGLILQATDTATPSALHTFGKCSYSNPSSCSFDLGSQNASGAATVKVYYFTGNTTDKLSASTTTPQSIVPSSPFTSLGSVPGPGTALPTPGTLSVPINAAASSTTISFTDTTANFKTPVLITFLYQTVLAKMDTSALTSTISLGAKPNIVMSRSDSGTGTPTGTVHYVVVKQGVPSNTPATLDRSSIVGSDGTATLDLSALLPGDYTITLTFIGTGIYQQMAPTPIQFTISKPILSITIGPAPANAMHGSSVVIPVTTAVAPATTTCTGTFAATVISGLTTLANNSSLGSAGTGNVTFTPPSSGSYTISVVYSPDTSSSCATQTVSTSVTIP